jgi:hypothetical protein
MLCAGWREGLPAVPAYGMREWCAAMKLKKENGTALKVEYAAAARAFWKRQKLLSLNLPPITKDELERLKAEYFARKAAEK